MPGYPRLLALSLLAAALTAPARGAEVRGPQEAALPSPPLRLAACATREILIFDAYDVRLFLPEARLTPPYVFSPDVPKALEVTITMQGDVPGGIPGSWKERLERSLPPATIDRLEDIYDGLSGGDRLAVLYRPGSGSVVRVDGEPRLEEADHRLTGALLDVFMGDDPAHDTVRDQLYAGRRC